MESFADTDLRLLSVIDLPKSTLDPEIWDLDGDLPLLKDEFRYEIIERLMEMLYSRFRDPEKFVSKLYLIGSETSYRWTPESDLDVTVLVDLQELALQVGVSEEEPVETLAKILVSELNERVLEGTQHPVNYYAASVVPTRTALYDIQEEKWVVPAEKGELVDLEQVYYGAWMAAKRWAETFDLRLGELHRDLIDLESFKRDFALMGEHGRKFVEGKIRQRMAEIEEDIEELIDGYEEVREQRQRAFLDSGNGKRSSGLIRLAQGGMRYHAEGSVYRLADRLVDEEDGDVDLNRYEYEIQLIDNETDEVVDTWDSHDHFDARTPRNVRIDFTKDGAITFLNHSLREINKLGLGHRYFPNVILPPGLEELPFTSLKIGQDEQPLKGEDLGYGDIVHLDWMGGGYFVSCPVSGERVNAILKKGTELFTVGEAVKVSQYLYKHPLPSVKGLDHSLVIEKLGRYVDNMSQSLGFKVYFDIVSDIALSLFKAELVPLAVGGPASEIKIGQAEREEML